MLAYFLSPYSEATTEQVDAEARALANAAYERTFALLSEKKELAGELAKLLLEKEVIHKEDVESVLGKRPFGQPKLEELGNVAAMPALASGAAAVPHSLPPSSTAR